MSDYPQTLGSHVINLPNLAFYQRWLATHSHEILEVGEVLIISTLEEGLSITKIGDGVHSIGELKIVRSPKKYYRVSEEDLRELLTAAHYAWALENGGVDNWTWEADSRHDYLSQYNADQGTDFDDFEDLATHEMKGYAIIS